MPVILLDIAGTNSTGPAFQAAIANMGALGQATERITGQFTAYESTLSRVNAVADQFAGRIAAVEAAMGRVNAVLDAQNALMDRANSLYGASAASVDSYAAAQGRAAATVDAVTASIQRQTLALSDQATMQRLVNTGALTNTVASVGGSAVAADANAVAASRFGAAGRVLAGGAAGDIGVLGRAGAAILGPEGLAVGGLLYGGYKASQAGSGFQSAEMQTGAQIGNMGAARAAGSDILNYTGSGKAPYDATTLMRSIEPLLAHQYSQATVAAGLAPIAQLSAQNKAPDLTTSINAVNTYLAIMGSGAKSTAAQMTDAVNYISKMEKLTTIPPGQLSTALPRLLTGTQGTGLTPEEAGAALLKVGTANPSARLDSTSLSRLFQEMLVHNTVGAQKEASSLGLAMGPGSLNAYGGSFQAMVQAYATATAGPNQAAELAKLFPTTANGGGLMAFRELISGGGAQQSLGYQSQLSDRAGAAQAAYDAYSQGIHQQEVQLANQFNGDMVKMGTTINATVIPALVQMAKHALDAGQGAADGVKRLAATNIGVDPSHPPVPRTGEASRSPWGMLTDQITWLGGTAIPAALNATGHAVGQVGNLIDAPMRYTANVPPTAPLSPWERATGTLPHPFNRGTQPTSADITAQRSEINLGNPFRMVDFAPIISTLGKTTTLLDNFGSELSLAGGAAQTALAGLRNSLGPPSNAPLNADRSTLQMMIEGGATTPRMYTQLAALKGDLANSTYTPAQQQALYHQESQRVYAAATGPGDQQRVQSAQMMLDAAQQMNLPPAVIKRDQDTYLAALTRLYSDTETGTKKAADLRSVAVQGQTFGFQDRSAVLNRQLQDLDALAQVAQIQGNTGAYQKYMTQETNLKAANAQTLGLDPDSIALLKAQTQASLLATTQVTNVHPFFQKQPGLGTFEAGAGSTIARAGGVDPQTQETRLLRQELSAAQAENRELLQQIARNTGVRAQAAAAPPSWHGKR